MCCPDPRSRYCPATKLACDQLARVYAGRKGEGWFGGDSMHSWLVWLVFAIACVLLGFVGYHFAVHTLRFVTALFALAVVV